MSVLGSLTDARRHSSATRCDRSSSRVVMGTLIYLFVAQLFFFFFGEEHQFQGYLKATHPLLLVLLSVGGAERQLSAGIGYSQPPGRMPCASHFPRLSSAFFGWKHE